VATTGGIYLYNTQSMSATPTTISSVSGIVAIQVDPSGKWLLAANSSNILSAIPITSTGIVDTTRSEQTPVQLAGTPIQMAISPSDSNVIVAVALGTSGTQVFSFDWNSATPIGATPLKTVTPYNTSGGTAQSVAIDPQNRFLYIGETVALPNSTTGTGGLRVYTITSTGVNEITGSPYSSGGTGPHAILPESTGTYVYVANWAGNATGYGFKVTSSGALTPLSGSFTTGTDPVGLAEDNTDSFVLAVSSGGSPDLDAYSFDSSTGVLGTPLTVATTGTTPVAIVAVP
jgi:6-phosphogluconolactonase (cycloisomerase 2 family)